jgi:hypothetical protein
VTITGFDFGASGATVLIGGVADIVEGTDADNRGAQAA